MKKLTQSGTTVGEHVIARICADLLTNAGPQSALRFLNARTRFRYTGLYRAEPPLLRNLFLFDRENPALNLSGDVKRLDETYCAIVCTGDQPFATMSSQVEERLASHPARDTIRSYCGVPIRDESGCVWGTLCHFDERPRLMSPSEIDVLTVVASSVARHFTTMAPSS